MKMMVAFGYAVVHRSVAVRIGKPDSESVIPPTEDQLPTPKKDEDPCGVLGVTPTGAGADGVEPA